MSSGSPTPSMGSMVSGKSKSFDSTTLNIFWTLMEWDAEVKANEACIALAYFLAKWSTSSCSTKGSVVKISNFVPTRNA